MNNKGKRQLLRYAIGWVVVILLLMMVFSVVSCRGHKEIIREVPVPIHDSIYETKEIHDSIWIENTIKEYIKGDTVVKEHTQIKYVERIKTDTVSNIVEVPIEITKTVTQYVEKPLKRWQKGLMWCGVGFWIVVIVGGLALYSYIKGQKKV